MSFKKKHEEVIQKESNRKANNQQLNQMPNWIKNTFVQNFMSHISFGADSNLQNQLKTYKEP